MNDAGSEKVVLISLNWLGDVVMALPSLQIWRSCPLPICVRLEPI